MSDKIRLIIIALGGIICIEAIIIVGILALPKECPVCETQTTTTTTTTTTKKTIEDFSPEERTTSTTTATVSTKKDLGLGDKFTFDELEITIGSKYEFSKVKNQFSEHNNKVVVKLPVTIKNLKNETHHLSFMYYKFFGSKGTELDGVESYFDDSVDNAGDLRHGASYTKYFYFLYDGDGEYAIEFDDWSIKKTVVFNIKK